MDKNTLLVDVPMISFREPSKTNITVRFGGEVELIRFDFIEKYNIKNRLKWWLLCKILPFTITHWEK